MKCIQKETEIQRVPDSHAEKLVKNDNWNYIPKHIWKEKIRDFNKKEESSTVDNDRNKKKSEKKPKAKKVTRQLKNKQKRQKN